MAFGKSRGGRGKEFIAFPDRSKPQEPAAKQAQPVQGAGTGQAGGGSRVDMTAWWTQSWWEAESVEALKILAKMPWRDIDAYNDMCGILTFHPMRILFA